MLHRCTNEEQVKVVRVVARKIEKLSTQLVECAETVADGGGGGGGGGGEPEQEVQEDTEILRRDWSSQARLHHTSLSCSLVTPSVVLHRFTSSRPTLMTSPPRLQPP